MVNSSSESNFSFEKVLGLTRTDHFIFRQWQRGVSDSLIYEVFNERKLIKTNKTIIIVARSWLKRYKHCSGSWVKCNCELMIIVDSGRLITLYYSACQLGLFKQKMAHEIILIQ